MTFFENGSKSHEILFCFLFKIWRCANRNQTVFHESLGALGFTEHSFAHVTHVAETAGYILKTLGHDDRTIELAKIAGYLHDIGNLVNRKDHAQSGAVMAWSILNDMGCVAAEVATIVTAIGNHDEGTGVPVNTVAAAMILADKADARRSRVRNTDISKFDIHDRVNYSVKKSTLKINEEKTIVKLKLTVDTKFGSVMDYFEIFMTRMALCRKAAEKLFQTSKIYYFFLSPTIISFLFRYFLLLLRSLYSLHFLTILIFL